MSESIRVRLIKTRFLLPLDISFKVFIFHQKTGIYTKTMSSPKRYLKDAWFFAAVYLLLFLQQMKPSRPELVHFWDSTSLYCLWHGASLCFWQIPSCLSFSLCPCLNRLSDSTAGSAVLHSQPSPLPSLYFLHSLPKQKWTNTVPLSSSPYTLTSPSHSSLSLNMSPSKGGGKGGRM